MACIFSNFFWGEKGKKACHTLYDQTTQAVSVLEEALSKDLKLEEIRRDTLVRLQKKCTATGQNFPYTIPAKVVI